MRGPVRSHALRWSAVRCLSGFMFHDMTLLDPLLAAAIRRVSDLFIVSAKWSCVLGARAGLGRAKRAGL